MEKRYIRLVKAITGHGYVAEYYSEDGLLVGSSEIALADVDKMCGGGAKLRAGDWGRLTSNGILAVGLPKFLRDQGELEL